MPPTPRMHEPNATIIKKKFIVNSKTDSEYIAIWVFDEYSHLTIRLNIFLFFLDNN